MSASTSAQPALSLSAAASLSGVAYATATLTDPSAAELILPTSEEPGWPVEDGFPAAYTAA